MEGTRSNGVLLHEITRTHTRDSSGRGGGGVGHPALSQVGGSLAPWASLLLLRGLDGLRPLHGGRPRHDQLHQLMWHTKAEALSPSAHAVLVCCTWPGSSLLVADRVSAVRPGRL